MAIRPFRFLRDMLDLDETNKTAGKVVAVNDDADGYELVDAAAASGGAPTTATYIVQTSDGDLSAEQALADLATGIVKNTTTTGVLSIAAEGTDYYGPSGTDVALADGGTGASLSDPGADRIMFWDDSGSTVGFLQTGSGLSLSGTVLTAPGPAAGDGLALTGTVLSVNVDDSTLEIATDTLQVKDGGITAAKVASDVATQAELDAHASDTTSVHGITDTSALALTANVPSNATFNDHSARHENGGADEISVAGLSGELADPQPTDASKVDSGVATDGQILTADGAGGAAWETPAGGGGGGTAVDDVSLIVHMEVFA